MFATPFSVKINPLATNFQLQYIELQSDIQLKKTLSHLFTRPLYDLFYHRKISVASHPRVIRSSLFGSMHICKQIFSRMKYRKIKISLKNSDKHLENSLRIATTAIEPDTDALVSQKQGQISHYFFGFIAFSLSFLMF